MKSLAIFCGASNGINSTYLNAAKVLGQEMVNNFFDHFFKFIDHAVQEEFIRKDFQSKLFINKEAQKLIENMIL